jgi:hypothetical protein
MLQAGSPDEVTEILNLPHLSNLTMALVFIQTLIGEGRRKYFWG